MSRSMLKMFCLIVVILAIATTTFSQEPSSRCDKETETCEMTVEQFRQALVEIHREGHKKGYEQGFQEGFRAGVQRGQQPSAWRVESEMPAPDDYKRWESFEQLINPSGIPGMSR